MGGRTGVEQGLDVPLLNKDGDMNRSWGNMAHVRVCPHVCVRLRRTRGEDRVTRMCGAVCIAPHVAGRGTVTI